METMFRILCLDYGDIRIGIALSDLTQTIASGYETYERKSLLKDVEHIKEIVLKNSVNKVIFGLPLNMDGSESNQTLKTKKFAVLLKENLGANIDVDLYDERLTSMIAEKMLISADVSRKKRKMVIDKLSATIILQDYLDNNKRSI